MIGQAAEDWHPAFSENEDEDFPDLADS